MTRATEPVDTLAAFGVRLAAKLPAGDANGLKQWAALLVQQPRDRRYVIAQIDTVRVIDDVDDDTDTAVVRILRVEIAGNGLTKRAADLLLAATKARGVDPQLFEAEDD
jgi:hypothetical protein